MNQHRLRVVPAAALWLVSVLAPAPVFAHADILERLGALDRQIAQAPSDAALYRKRGELHRLHRDWPAARADYDRAAALEPTNTAVLFYRGRMWLEAGEPDRARPPLDRFIAARPGHADARLVRSRVRAQQGDWQGAAADLTQAIAVLDPPTPEVYLDRARALVAADRSQIELALHGLDEAIDRLGPLVTLIQYAIELERARGAPQQALARLDTLPDKIAQQPAWLALRGDILHEVGDPQQARSTYRAGLATIEAYPPARRNARATAALEARLRASLR